MSNVKEELLKNKLLNTKNFLNYTGLTYEDIIERINIKLSSDPNFDNFRESSIAQMVLEIFAGTADMCNFMISRRSQESFFDTAKLESSHILLARSLAYDPKRKIPSETSMQLKIKGDITTSTLGKSEQDVRDGNVKIQIPQYTDFSVNGNNFLLKNLFTYTLLWDTDCNQGDDFERVITLSEMDDPDEDKNIKLIQGELKINKITGTNNDQLDQIFQSYRITDKTFSNMYGERDYTTGSVTEVGIGSTVDVAFATDNIYIIDRRSLLRQDSIDTYNFNDSVHESKKICLIRSALDLGIDLLFGDGKYVAKGLENSSDNIYIKYLSTLGVDANKVGIINESLTLLDDVSNYNIDIEYNLISNIIGGSNFESNDSIKANAPAIFYSLDRVVTKKDYIAFLKSLSSPLAIQNAIAWGEQDEVDKLKYNSANVTSGTNLIDNTIALKKLFNVCLFSCLASLYNISDDDAVASTPKTNYSDIVLDADYNEFQMPSQNYMAVLGAQDVIKQIKFQQAQIDGTHNTGSSIVGVDPIYTDFIDFSNYIPSVNIGLVLENISTEATTQMLLLSAATATSFDGYATLIQNALTSASYDFGENTVTNYDSTNNRFKVNFIDDTQTYKIKYMYDTLGNSTDYFTTTNANVLGLLSGSNVDATFPLTDFAYSNNISTVLDYLSDKSQMTIKNVYISPVIQDFNITGIVYIKSLINRDLIQKKIDNKIYAYLDDNADFSVEIYKSDIINIITSFPEVSQVDINIEPNIPTLVTGNSSHLNIEWLTNLNHPALKYINNNSEKLSISTSILDLLEDYLDRYQVSGTDWNKARGYISEETRILPGLDTVTRTNYVATSLNYLNGYLVRDKKIKWSVDITERTFFYDLVKGIIDKLKISGIKTSQDIYFYESAEFYSLINDIHNDLLYIIRYNMLDKNGNIAAEYNRYTVGNKIINEYVRGGYSLGNEIVKLTMNNIIRYK